MKQKLTRREFLKKGRNTAAAAAAVSTVGTVVSGCADKAKPHVPDGSYIKAERPADGEVIETDLLIIGSGFAGLWAAITAAEQGVEHIAVVDKGSIGKSSAAANTLAGTAYLWPGDDKLAWLKELCEGCGYLLRQDIWDDLLETSYSRMKKLESWGLVYEPAFPLAPRRIKTDGNKHIKLTFNPKWNKKGLGAGRAVTGALAERMQSFPNIRYFSKTMITELLKEGDAIAGAVGVNRLTGNAVAFKSRAVIMGTGSCSFKGQHAVVEVQTGDGYALAYHAGATLNNMEFFAFDVDPVNYGFEGGSLMGQFGCRFLNGKHEDFMWNYDPENGSVAHVKLTTRAMSKEVEAGRGPIYLDHSSLFYQVLGKRIFEGIAPDACWQSLNAKRLEEVGFDPASELRQWIPASFAIIGCVKGDVNCMTDVPGLYAIGITLSTDPGKMKGCESARAMWSGEKSGMDAARYIEGRSEVTLPASTVKARIAAAKAPMAEDGGMTPNEVTRKLQEIVFKARVSILKNEKELTKALDRVIAIRDRDLPKMSAPDPHELAKYHETRNMVLCAELFLRASLERKESRENHYREEYPKMDNKNWLKWINFNKGADNRPVISFERVPVENYPLQPATEDV